MTSKVLLGTLLKNVSRSFYLTLRVLPAGLREPIGLAYLLARAADTIADTAILPSTERLDLLLALRANINGGTCANDRTAVRIAAALGARQQNPHERALLKALQPALELLDSQNAFDKSEIQRVVTTLTQGMEFDLRTFPNESSGKLGALKTTAELEHYSYLVAGCVGEFWTVMTCAHQPKLRAWNVPEMSALGVRFGKALQYTNILRDVPGDLRIGRCYIPEEVLSPLGLMPNDLLDPANSTRARPALLALAAAGLEHYDAARRYTLAIPAQCLRLRLACLWPILIGLPTFSALGRNSQWLDPAKKSKISRSKVRRILALSLPAVASNTLLDHWIERNLRDAAKALR